MKPHTPLRYVLGCSALFALYSAQAAPQVWDDGGATANWNTTDLNWDAGSIWTNGNDAQFTGTGVGAVTITEVGGVSANSLDFTANGYSVGGSELLTLTGTGNILVSAGLTATINAVLEGTGGMSVNGGGTLNLGGANTIDGGGDASRGLTVGSSSANNTVNLSSGGTMAQVSGTERRSLIIGGSTFGGNNVVMSTPGTVSNQTFTVLGNSGRADIGTSSSGNSLELNNGAYLGQISTGGTTTWNIGQNSGADNNSLTVTGAGTTIDFASNHAVVVGSAGSGNSVLVSAGGTIELRRWQVGAGGGDNNSVTITGAGSRTLISLTTPGAGSTNALMEIGNAGSTGNSISVEAGGSFQLSGGATNRNITIGNAAGADGNSFVVTGSGSSATIQNSNPLSIGGTFLNSVITNSTAANNHMDVYSGASATLNGVYLQGVNSSFNLGNGTGLSVATIGSSTGAVGMILGASDSRLNIDSGRVIASGNGNLVSGSGEVVLDGAAYFSTVSVAGSNVTTVISGGGSLTKEDTGLLVLSGANSYTGDTTVADGTLSLQSAYLDDASTISVLGVLDLNTAGATDLVGSLYLGGILQTLAGTYGSTSSTATYQNDTYFSVSGDGMLQIVPEPGVALLGGLGLLSLLRRRRNA